MSSIILEGWIYTGCNADGDLAQIGLVDADTPKNTNPGSTDFDGRDAP